MNVKLLPLLVAAALLTSAAPPPFVDLATPFDRVADATAGQSEPARIAAVRDRIDAMLPGVYPPGSAMDQRIARSLEEWPTERANFRHAVSAFPVALANATARFRKMFPGFSSPLPIYIYHSLGMRDGGSDYLEPGHRHVMLFGADMIAAYHDDNSIEPFFDHELFHLEHGRHFPDCDQLWCPLWQEGLAVYAAAAMTPGATDHQLLLDLPKPIRAQTEANMSEALCFIAAHFDDKDDNIIATTLQGGAATPPNLPNRFGYYVGFQIARATGRTVPDLDRLGPADARPIVRTALIRMMTKAGVHCPSPKPEAKITASAPHSV